MIYMNKKNKRTRTAAVIQVSGKNILIDVSPDFREQAIRERIKTIDYIIVTHPHADHIYGIPDIRSYSKKNSIKLFIYGSKI